PPSQFTACSEYFAVHYFSAHDEAIGNLTNQTSKNSLSQIFYLFLSFHFKSQIKDLAMFDYPT
ncbi:hypothetical protein, partial [Carboxylicivirga marina]|uniref:hypothetical protein n=1 Tax=Carboxylicivirga marina TaxID=2800988 RepID=UPI001F172DF6